MKMQFYAKRLAAFALFNLTFAAYAQNGNLKLHYDFKEKAKDVTGNGYDGTLQNGASNLIEDGEAMLYLGTENGYLDLGKGSGKLIESLNDFSVAANLFIPESTDLGTNGNFIWCFSKSDDAMQSENGYIYLGANQTKYAITRNNWRGESTLQGNAMEKGCWKTVVYIQKDGKGRILVDGKEVKAGNIELSPKELGNPTFNFLGRSPYREDVFLKGAKYEDFRIYEGEISTSDMDQMYTVCNQLNSKLNRKCVKEAAEKLTLSNLNAINANIKLPQEGGNGVKIEWSNSPTSSINSKGEIVRPKNGQKPVTIELKATFSKGYESETKVFKGSLLPLLDSKASVKSDLNTLSINRNINNLRQSLVLPHRGMEGSDITWKSSNPALLTDEGVLNALSPNGKGKTKVTLTATVSKEKEEQQKVFTIEVAEDEGTTAYLFAYFTGNHGNQEAIRFALSSDGYHYTALNNDQPIIDSKTISETGGVRDPHILRGEDGNFYMVVTDMVCERGWDSNRGMVLLKSSDLVNWNSSKINFQQRYSGQEELKRVWAPQTIYDPQAKKYLVYFSLQYGKGADVIYYAYANKDFTDLEGEPKPLFIPKSKKSCIDGDIIFKDGLYHLFYKTEGNGNGIRRATTNNLTSGKWTEYNDYLQQTKEAVEGSCVFKMINSDDYILMYDMYTSGKYQFAKSEDLEHFTVVDKNIRMNFKPRHGTVMPITTEEAQRVINKWGATYENAVITGAANPAVKRINIEIDNTTRTIVLPVVYGTNLKMFDPQFEALPGVVITPKGEQDFSHGPVSYTVKVGEYSRTYKVNTLVRNNPSLIGYYADPEILYSEKTGKYYIYPTSDGFDGWGGYYFKVFSSENLVNWKEERVILNLKTDVIWTDRNAWAPCIIEKKINGEYKYFYYYTGGQKIGVAVANDPTGPFSDIGSPLIKKRPEGVRGGQEIDPDIFCDPISGKDYIYWGNGYLAVAELNDMTSYDEKSVKIITPSDRTFREGVYVFYRKGIYYFMWSEDDTRSPNYAVRYGMSKSPTGPIEIPKNNKILMRNNAAEIYGTAHNSVLQLPGKDEWYVVYHRFNRPNGITMGDAAGFNREVCIDKMEFNEDGTIKPIIPTLEGIAPVK